MAEKKARGHAHNFQDLAGRTFGRLTVLSFRSTNHNRKPLWLCRCECGKEVVVLGPALKTGHTFSCGCFRRESTAAMATTHGQSDSPESIAWMHIKGRCHNKKNRAYPEYGGRGIVVCERWRNSFESFLADMGKKPTAKHTIERKNNDGNYEPSNCVWATRIEQMRNTRRTHRLIVDGKTMCAVDLALLCGVTDGAVRYWIGRGKTGDEILSRYSATAKH